MSTTQAPTRRARVYQPAIDLVELEQEFVVRADMPGLSPQDVDVTCERGFLSIHGRIPDDARVRRERPGMRSWLREYGIGDYRREIRLGDSIDPERIQAEYADGVLTIHLPKVAAATPRRVTIRGAEDGGDGREPREPNARGGNR
jgi:HSP20 family protein